MRVDVGQARQKGRSSLNALRIAVFSSSLLALATLSACSSMTRSGTSGDSDDDSPAPKSIEAVISDSAIPSGMVTQQDGEIYVRGVRLANSKFDYPVVVNPRVEMWISYFTGKGRKHFARYLERGELFIPYIQPILKSKGLPQDLVYLAMIESGFSNHARSFASAVGPWQFISATGRRYGLEIDWWVDQRRDIERSTIAAADYLRDLYKMFGSWELASAAYNAGEGKIARGLRRYKADSFWEIAQTRFLKPETRDYVPKIMAAAIVSKNRAQFGFGEPGQHTHLGSDEAVAPDGELVKVIRTENPESQLDAETRTQLASDEGDDGDDGDEGDDGDTIANAELEKLADSAIEVQVAESDDSSTPKARPAPTPHVAKDGSLGGEQIAEFEIQSPADLLHVARAAGLSYQTVKALNPAISRWCTPPTRKAFRVKLPQSVRERFLSAYNQPGFQRKVRFLSYKVRRGDTLAGIARHFGIKVDPLRDLNGMGPKTPLRQGALIQLPLPLDRSRSLASLDVRDPPERSRRRFKRARGTTKKYYKISPKRRESARSSKNAAPRS